MKKFICTEDYPVVETDKGKLRGFLYNDIFTFYGVRYARARRFEMPEEIPAWEGIQDALGYGYISPILGSPKPSGEVRIQHRFWPANENCQYLNIWTKAINKEAKKPVIVWFHGGGFADGSSIEQACYDGNDLAAREDVVVVTVNHRLNAFGFLDLSAYGEEWWNSGNVGLADLVECLKWIHRNIAGFGGDPGNVTIVGQSGGGMKVTSIGQIKEAAGLFHKAIPMSGIVQSAENGSPLGILSGTITSADIAKAVFEECGIPEGDVKALQQVPVPAFISAVNRAGLRVTDNCRLGFGWGPKANAYYAGDPMVVGFSEYYRTVPTLTTTVIAEVTARGYKTEKTEVPEEEQKAMLAAQLGEEKAEKLSAAFKKAFPDKPLMNAPMTDQLMRPATIAYTKKKAEESSAPVYNYLFSLEFDLEGGVPAWHCADIPFIFHTKKVQACMDMGPEVDRLEDLISGAVANFARTGDPNTEGLPEWKPSDKDHCVTMIFDKECRVGVDFDDELLEVLDEVLPFPGFGMVQFYNEEAESEHDWMY